MKEKGELGWRINHSLEKQTTADQQILVNFVDIKFSGYDINLTSNFIPVQIGTKSGNYESPSRDRLVYLTTCLIGHHVEVQVKNGSIYSGIFHATNAEKDFGMFCSFVLFVWFLYFLFGSHVFVLIVVLH